MRLFVNAASQRQRLVKILLLRILQKMLELVGVLAIAIISSKAKSMIRVRVNNEQDICCSVEMAQLPIDVQETKSVSGEVVGKCFQYLN